MPTYMKVFTSSKFLLRAALTSMSVILLSPPSLHGQPCAPPPSGLVSWWQGESNANDAADGNHGTLIGNTAYAAGKVGQAFSFDGSGDAVQLGNPVSLQLQIFTIEAWIRRSSAAQPSQGPAEGIFFGYGGGGYAFGLKQDGHLFLTQNGVSEVISSSQVTDTNFHHVAVTKTGSTVVFYADGVAYPAASFNSVFTFASNAAIGAEGGGFVSGFWGLIDELDVFNRALTSLEIQSIYNAGSAGKCLQPPDCLPAASGLVNWWRGEDNANDSTGGNNGTLQNGAAFAAGKVGRAFSFDGVNDSVSFGNTAGNFGTNNFTIEFWIKTSSLRPEVILNNNPVCSYSSFVSLGIGSVGAGKITAEMYSDNAGNNGGSVIAIRQVNDGVFHHVAFVRQGSNLAYYIDGTLDSTGVTAGVASISNTANLVAGTSVCVGIDSTSNFTGQMDEISIYHRALTPSEIQTIYNAGSAGKCPPPAIVSAFTNGSFELPVQTTGLGQNLPPGSTAVTGWTVGTIVGMGWQNGASSGVNPVDGVQHIGFNGGNAAPGSYIYQTFSTTVGQTYTASYYVGRTGGGGGTMGLLAEVTSSASALLGSMSTTAPGSPGYGPIQTFTFTATTATSTLTFTDTSSATVAVDVLLDNVTVAPVPQCVVPPAGLVSWWQAESNANDSSTNIHGVLIGNVAYASGKVGQAFSLDGNGDAVLLGNPARLRIQDFSIDAWVRRNNTSQPSQGSGAGLFLGYGGGGYAFGLHADGRLFLTSVGISEVVSTSQITDTNFHHVAVTKTGSTVVFYVDGAAYPASSFSTVFSFGSQVAIGARGDNFDSSFWGIIDELDVFNRALSAVEIQSIYNAGVIGKCGIAPSITSQPADKTVPVGADATFTVGATGGNPLNYQWRVNGTNIVAATNTALTLTSVQLADTGVYSVVVSNAVSSVTSSNATLTVNLPMCVAAPSNLVSWWQGEGNAQDAQGTNHGALIGNVTYAAGRVGQAFSFDGSGDAVRVGNSTGLQLQNLTIEAWIKRSSTSTASLDVGGGLIFGSGGGGYGLGVFDNGSLYLTKIGVSFVASAFQITDTNYHQIAVTKTGNAVVFYLDGVAYPAANLGAVFTFTSQSAIGARGDNSANSFLGIIDEVAVYNRALSQAEVQSIYNAGGLGKCGLAPTILSQSQGRTVAAGTNVTFNVVATGTSPLSYQWQFNTTNIVGATSSSLVLSNVQSVHSGNYTVVVGNSVNAVSSAPVNLKVTYVFVFGNGQPLTNTQHSFVDTVSIQLQTVLTNGTLFYTLDGSTPSFASAQYLGPFPVTHTSFLRVLTYSADFFESYEADAITLFIIPTFTISATTAGGGTVSVSPTNSPYASNTVVTVTATPTNGWIFQAWQGDANGTNPVINVTMDRNKSVQAIFGTALSTTVAGGGAITVIPSAPLYPFGTVVQLYAIPQAGNYFALWGNAASGSSNPLSFTINNANPMISSLFGALVPGQFTLTVVPNGLGQIAVSPQTNRYSSGQNATVTAIPDAGQQFIDWSGDAGGTDNPLLLTMTQSKFVTANFTQPNLLAAGPQRLNSEGFHLTLTGELGGQYRIDGATNLPNWTELFTVIIFGPVPLLDTSATNTSQKFYRAVKVP